MAKQIKSIFIIIIMLTLASCNIFSGNSLSKTSSDNGANIITDGTNVVIDIQTAQETKIRPEAVGEHNAITNQNYVINSKDFLKVAEDYGRIGFIRWTGGTSNNGVNWRLGAIDAEYSAQSYLHKDRYYKQIDDRINVETKGYDRISALREFLQKNGSKAMIVANVFQQSPEEIGDLAKYLYDNHIPVTYFELGNEVEFFTEASDSYLIYKSGTDYLDRGKAFNDAIKKNYPGAKVIIAMSNKGTNQRYDNEIYTYANSGKKFWDAITVHRFQGNGKDLTEAMKSGNSALEEWKVLLDGYVKKFNDPKLEIYIGEQSPALGGTLAGTMYQGVYQAESVMRLLSHPNITYTVGWYIDKDSLDDSYVQKFNDAWQKGVTIDSVNIDYKFLTRIPIMGAQIAAGALNQSEAYWETTVTGGAQVDALTGKKPALYSKAYKGANGTNYAVITNKSGEVQSVTIRMDDKVVSSKDMTKTFIANDKPGIKNVEKTPNNVKIITQSTENPVQIPPYSVTRIEWKGDRAPDKPNPPSLIYADAGKGDVSLKWAPALRTERYKVKYGTESGKYTKEIDIGNVTQYMVSGLQTGKTYYFAVTAHNSAGESSLSNEAAVELSPPQAPLIRTAHAERASRAIIEWQSVPNAAGYRLMYGTQPGKYDNAIDLGNNVGQIVKDLINEIPYYFTVQAYNGVGDSILSQEVKVIPKDSLPFAPHNLLVGKESETSITLSWKPSLTDTVQEFFNEVQSADWSQVQGAWKTTSHPAKGRDTGVYKLAEGGVGISLYDDELTNDYEIEALIDSSRSTAKEQIGLIARYRDANNYYLFKLESTTGTFTVVKIENGNETILQKKKLTIDPEFLRIHLRLEGDTLTAVANREEVARITDKAYAEGKAGVYSTGTNGMFDYIRIWESNADTYDLYRSTDPHIGYVKIAEGLIGGSYTDDTPNAGTTYFYYLKARNEKGESYHHSNIARKY